MVTYVLVGGGWLGGWCWQRVARLLREEGHDAYPTTLTGLGDRVHLASPEVDLETHIIPTSENSVQHEVRRIRCRRRSENSILPGTWVNKSAQASLS